ncbi:MAG: BdrN protein [Firmicutes bacterium]|jgi:hypothetical protein|nr:BdrN protein [Bacillota bacterium]
MVWLNPNDYKSQEYVELRLNAPKTEKVCLEFNPLRMARDPHWNPMWEEWHCYASPLRIYKQDYELLLSYFDKIYPIKDAFDGTLEPVFDVCFYNWIGKSDWLRLIDEIEQDLNCVNNGKKVLLTNFLAWVKKALKHTSIIVVESNL